MNFRNYFAFSVAAAALSAQAAFAQTPAGMSSKEPVEINADQLEVRQQENVAVFTGNVIAVQGTTRLKSDIMTVHYKQKEQQPDAVPSAPGDVTQSSVEKIVVDGNVLLTTPEETASGDNGVYDVPKKEVTLYHNVVLTRGKNVLKGDSLVYDMAAGKSVINSPHHALEGGSAPVGRVRALFVPEKK